MARQNPKCRIVALEPYDENFRCLQMNVASARSTNITCCEMALGGTSGHGRMESVGKRSLDHILQASEANGGSIPVVTLNDLFDLTASRQIDFLKVDIEGSEHETFRDARPDLLARFKRIALEYHDAIAPGTMTMLEKVLASSHDTVNLPSTVSGCGILRALRKPGMAPSW
jgi:FkbM family methyltransferase